MSRPREKGSSWLRAARGRLSLVRQSFRRPTTGHLAVFLASASAVVWLAAASPFGRDFSVQLLYLPILGAAWAIGPLGALIAGTLAAIGEPAFGQMTSHAVAQPLLYFGFAGVCASIGIGSGSRPIVAASSGRGTSTGEGLAGRERILESLARTVEVRDHHTEGHCRRVAKNATALGRALGLEEAQVDVLYWAGLLHDVGKIAVPDYILLKNGRLSDEEFAEIRRHATYGADLLTSVSFSFREIADVVRAHHERWDGLGYPLGLRGGEIPHLARIIAVVDVFEALTSQRPYRSPITTQQALAYIKNGSGNQFDPDVVLAFERLIYDGSVESAVDGDTDSLLGWSHRNPSVSAPY